MPDDLWEPDSQGQGVSYKKRSHNQLLTVRAFFIDVESSAPRIFLWFPVTIWALLSSQYLLLGHFSLVEKHIEMMVFIYQFYCFSF